MLAVFLSIARAAADYHGSMAELRIPAKEIGSDLAGPTGLVKEKGREYSFPPDIAAKMAEKIKPLPIAMADANYTKGDGTTIVIQLMYFESKAKASEQYMRIAVFRKKEGEHVVASDCGDSAFDYKSFKKRIVLIDNMIVTCTQMPEGDDALKILKLYLAKIRKPQSIHKVVDEKISGATKQQ